MVTVRQRAKNVLEEVDLDAMDRQSAYYKKLKAMYPKKLKALHEKTFKNTKWWHAPPKGVARHLLKEWLIRRLWIYYAVKNYHFPKGSEIRAMFVKRAKAVLSNKLDQSTAYSDNVLSKKLQSPDWISKEGIDSLSDEEVDQLLTRYGVNFADDIPSEQRRYALWELYSKPGSKTLKTKPSAGDKRGEKQVAAKKASSRSKVSLKEFVIEHPHLSFRDFQKKYGKKYPTVTSGYFAVTKSLLRKEGYVIPKLNRSGDSAEDTGPAKKARKKKAKKAKSKPTRTVVKDVKAKKKTKKKAKKRSKK